jgi:hypothetical protein
MSFEKFVSVMKQGVVSLFFLGLIVYSAQMAAYAFNWSWAPTFMTTTTKSQYIFGLPICGIAAFSIVCVLEKFSMPKTSGGEKMEFKAFGLTFSGPAGPITLWIVCYLSLVASMEMVK